MKRITVEDLVCATEGKLLCGDPQCPVENISIDSRKMKGADLFVPIIGAKVDAHHCISGAFLAGAVATLTSEHDEMQDSHAWIQVRDTVEALQKIGTYCRKRLTMPIIGITGSVGKTTTREMVTAALSAQFYVNQTAGNSNGQLGVPITLSGIDPQSEIVVLEMGMSEPGEMEKIADIARIDMGVVTNIGVSHIENLGSQERICQEKMHLADHFSSHQMMILNGDDPYLFHLKGKTPYSIIYYGLREECDYRATNIEIRNDRTYFTVTTPTGEFPLSLGVPGIHNVRNALAALVVADKNGVPLVKAAEKLAQYQGFSRRLEIFSRNQLTIIDDSYNASPESMKAALQVLSDFTPAEGGRRVAILADMLELGDYSVLFHQQVGAFASTCPIQKIFTIGNKARDIAREAEKNNLSVTSFDSNEQGIPVIKEWLKSGDVVLVKGSNGMKLHEIVKEL